MIGIGENMLEQTIYPVKVTPDRFDLVTLLGDDEMTKERRIQKNGTSRKFKIKKNKRLALYLRDAFTCAFCGIDMKGTDPRLITLDHIKPRAQGGTDDPTNLVTACLRCNCVKKDTNITKFCGKDKANAIRKAARVDLKPFRTTANAILKGLEGYGD
jgi:5-methylcytosine-specific restriction endonuclease McrA